jgi:hypothetical protein
VGAIRIKHILRHPRICDPARCSHCEYIGEGDFICDSFSDKHGNPAIMVMSDWEPTENYLRCRKVVKQANG